MDLVIPPTGHRPDKDVQTGPPTTNRLTVAGSVYHLVIGQNPTSIQLAMSRSLQGDEEAFSRNVRLETAWTPLPLGWFLDKPEEAGVVVLSNEEGKRLQVQPTPEERAAIGARVVELGTEFTTADGFKHVVPFARVRPGESLPLEPVDHALVRLRCLSPQGQPARCRVYVFPR